MKNIKKYIILCQNYACARQSNSIFIFLLKVDEDYHRVYQSFDLETDLTVSHTFHVHQRELQQQTYQCKSINTCLNDEDSMAKTINSMSSSDLKGLANRFEKNQDISTILCILEEDNL